VRGDREAAAGDAGRDDEARWMGDRAIPGVGARLRAREVRLPGASRRRSEQRDRKSEGEKESMSSHAACESRKHAPPVRALVARSCGGAAGTAVAVGGSRRFLQFPNPSTSPFAVGLYRRCPDLYRRIP
jgi:hypothetical protein